MSKLKFISSGVIVKKRVKRFTSSNLTPRKRAKKCFSCRKIKDDLKFCSDPYESDVRGDESKHWFCQDCLDDSAQDI